MGKTDTASYDKRLVRWISGIGLTLSLYVIAVDWGALEPAKRGTYVAGRLGTAAVCALVLLTNLRRSYPWQVPLLFLSLVAYSAHGQLYLPCYYLAYMESIIPLGLFFPIPQRQFYSMIGVSVAAMLVAVFATGASYTADPAIAARFRFDAAMGVIITTVISVLGYHYITRNRREKDLLAEKFLDVGRHTSSIMHDLKGLLSTPLTYVHLLESRSQGWPQRDREALQLLGEDLGYLNRYVHEVNAFTNMRANVETFRLSEVVDSIRILLRAPLRKVELRIESDPLLRSNRNALIKVFYNLIINSIEASAQQGGRAKGVITLGCEPSSRSLTLRDNGPGFGPDNVRALNSRGFAVSSKGSGSLGTYLTRELVESRGGRLLFGNRPEGGAEIRIVLTSEEFHPEPGA